MALKITSHVPAINATGVFRNETIRIYFDRPIEPSTVTWDTISVQEKSSFTTVVGTLGVGWTSSGTVVEANFAPALNMLANTDYTVYVFGDPNSIIAKDGTLITDTYTFNFTTGTGYYDASGNVGVPSGIDETTPSGDPSGILPSSGVPTSMTVYSTSPSNRTPNLDLSLSSIDITFTTFLYSDLSNISGYVTVEEEGVLG